MTKIERSIYIEATSEEIDLVSLDPERTTEWYVGLEHFEADSFYPEPGSMGHGTMKAAGMTTSADMRVVERIPGQSFVYTLEGGMNGEFRWSHRTHGSGTQVSLVAEYELPGGVLGKLADKLVVEREIATNMEKSLENLKRISEAIHEPHA